MKYSIRRKLSLIALLVGLPVYIVLVVVFIDFFQRQNIFLEFLIYVFLGIVWVFPLKYVFKGVGQLECPEDRTK